MGFHSCHWRCYSLQLKTSSVQFFTLGPPLLMGLIKLNCTKGDFFCSNMESSYFLPTLWMHSLG